MMGILEDTFNKHCYHMAEQANRADPVANKKIPPLIEREINALCALVDNFNNEDGVSAKIHVGSQVNEYGHVVNKIEISHDEKDMTSTVAIPFYINVREYYDFHLKDFQEVWERYGGYESGCNEYNKPEFEDAFKSFEALGNLGSYNCPETCFMMPSGAVKQLPIALLNAFSDDEIKKVPEHVLAQHISEVLYLNLQAQTENAVISKAVGGDGIHVE